jgi:nitroreductase
VRDEDNVNKLYLLTQTHVRGYDTFDSCVVCAPDREDARAITPAPHGWPTDLEHVVVIELGVANEALQPGVVCASFHAG